MVFYIYLLSLNGFGLKLQSFLFVDFTDNWLSQHARSCRTLFIWLTLDDFIFYGILTLSNLICMYVSSCKSYLSYAILFCSSKWNTYFVFEARRLFMTSCWYASSLICLEIFYCVSDKSSEQKNNLNFFDLQENTWP